MVGYARAPDADCGGELVATEYRYKLFLLPPTRVFEARVNMAESTISITTRQEWFTKNLVALLHARGVDAVDEAIKANAPQALAVALQMMQSAQSEGIRAKAAFEILKLSQGTKVTIKSDVNASQLDKQIEQLSGEIEMLTKAKN